MFAGSASSTASAVTGQLAGLVGGAACRLGVGTTTGMQRGRSTTMMMRRGHHQLHVSAAAAPALPRRLFNRISRHLVNSVPQKGAAAAAATTVASAPGWHNAGSRLLSTIMGATATTTTTTTTTTTSSRLLLTPAQLRAASSIARTGLEAQARLVGNNGIGSSGGLLGLLSSSTNGISSSSSSGVSARCFMGMASSALRAASHTPGTHKHLYPMAHAMSQQQRRDFRGAFGGSSSSSSSSGGGGGGGEVSQQELDDLFDAAEDSPRDADAQASLLEVLAEELPDEAVRRFESGRYASNDECVRHYLSALVYSGDIQNRRLDSVLTSMGGSSSRIQGSGSDATLRFTSGRGGGGGGVGGGMDMGYGFGDRSNSNSNSGGGGGGDFGGRGNSHEPLHVVMQEPSTRAQMWRLVRLALFLLLFF